MRPASEGLAIPKAVRLPKNSLSGLSSLEPRTSDGAAEPAPQTPEPPPSAPPTRTSGGTSGGTSANSGPPGAPSPSGPPVAAALIRELEGVRDRIGKVSFYELLGVKPEASVQVLRTAYTQLAKKYHPDSLGGGGDEATVNLAREVSAALNEAYTALSDNEKRKKYDDQLRAGNLRGDEAQAGRFNSAKLKFEMGSVFLKKRDYKKARETLRFAVDLAPESGLFRGTLAWAYLADPGHDRKDALEKAEKLLLEGVKQAPREAQLHYYLGRLYKERGELGLAEPAFKRALQLDSKLHDAESELRVLERRREKDTKPEKASPLQALTKLFKR
jgi:curved DNA-binding protein CbpA